MGESAWEAELIRLLEACGRPSERAAAEARLAEAESREPSSFLVACAGVLRQRQAAPGVRQLAGLLIKKALRVGPHGEAGRGPASVRRWLEAPEEARGRVRGAVLEVLTDPHEPDPGVRRAAGLCAARVGAADCLSGGWPALVPALSSAAAASWPATCSGAASLAGPAEVAAAECMRTLGFYAEEWRSLHPGENDKFSDALRVMSAALGCLREGSRSAQVAAARTIVALLSSVEIPELASSSEGAVELLGAVVKHCGPGTPDELREEAMRCLAKCAVQCYPHMGSTLPAMTEACVQAMGTACDAVAVQAAEAWSELAEHELGLLRMPATAGACLGLTQTALPALLPGLFGAMTRSCPREEDDDESALSDAACACLAVVAPVVADACVAPVVAFVETGSCSQKAAERRAALLAFGAIQDGPTEQVLSPLVRAALPSLLAAMTGPRGEAAAASWAAGRALDLRPAAVPDTAQQALYEVCVQSLRREPRLAEELCYCISGLVDQQAATLPPEMFECVASALLDSAVRVGEQRARASLLRLLAELVARAGEDCVPLMMPALPHLLAFAKAEADASRQLDGATWDGVRAMLLRLGAEGARPHAEQLLALCLSASEAQFRAHQTLDDGALRTAGALARALGQEFAGGFSALWPQLQASMVRADAPEVCCAGVACFRDSVAALGGALAPYAAGALDALGGLLQQSEGSSVSLQAEAVAALGELGCALGPRAPELPALLERLLQVAAVAAGPEAPAMVAVPGVHGASKSDAAPRPRLCQGARATPAATAAASRDQTKQQEVAEALLEAFEAVIRGCLAGGPLPQAAREAAPRVLQLVCVQSGLPGASHRTMRNSVKIFGALAADAEADVAALAASSQDVAACVSRLVAYGVASPNARVREMCQPLARVSVAAALTGLEGSKVAACA